MRVGVKLGELRLSWTAVVKGDLTVHYELEDHESIVINKGADLSHQFFGLTDGEKCFRVRAVTESDQSAYDRECVTITLLSAPARAPSITNNLPQSTSEAYDISWGAVENATAYELWQRINSDREEDWTLVVDSNTLTYRYSSESAEIGTHQYRIYAKNSAGRSENHSGIYTLSYELDPTTAIRGQLYYNDAQDIPASADNIRLGLLSREVAAFRYLDLMYIVDANSNQVINRFASGEATADFSTLYDQAERDRAQNVEDYIVAEMVELEQQNFPPNSNLERFMLDVYYDRAVAEMVLANQALDNARLSRLRATELDQENINTVDEELIYIEEAYDLLYQALNQYNRLLDNSPELLIEYAASRGQISPRYYDDDDLAQNVTSDDRLFTGYKDIVMLYQLMNMLMETQIDLARLNITSGETNGTLIDMLNQDIESLKEDLFERESRLVSMFEGVDFTEVEGFSGLPSQVFTFKSNLQKLDTALSWLAGEANILGLPQDSVLLVQGNVDEGAPFDSFDRLYNISQIQVGLAEESLNTAQESYNNYEYRSDLLAGEFLDRHQVISEKLFDLTGVRFARNCFEDSCLIAESDALDGSAISLQANNIESAEIALLTRIEEMTVLTESIDYELEALNQAQDIFDAREEVVLRYGDQQATIAGKIEKLRAEQAASSGRFGGIGGIVSTVAAFSAGPPGWANLAISLNDNGQTDSNVGGDRGQLIGGLAGAVTNIGAANQSIKNTKSIAKLEETRVRLAAEERAELIQLDSELFSLEVQKRIKNLWLEVNVKALDVAQAEALLEQEVERLMGMLNKANELASQIYSTNANIRAVPSKLAYTL